MTDFDELLERVRALTGLEGRDAAKVAFDLDDDPKSQEIVDKAIELGFDVDRKHARVKQDESSIGPDISIDPAVVLAEVYENCPRVLMANMPKLGRAPAKAEEFFAEELAELPEEIVAMLVKIDLYEGKVTFWLRDEANDVDRPIGPISLSRYEDENALGQALTELVKRLPRVLAADCN